MLDPGDVVAYTDAQGQYIPRSKRLLMLARDLANGWYTVEALAQRYDVCERTIYRWWKRVGYDPLGAGVGMGGDDVLFRGNVGGKVG